MKNIIISAIGTDQLGIVSKLSSIINSHRANIEESRMTILGSDFVVVMLISLKEDCQEALLSSLNSIENLSISIKETSSKKIIKHKSFNIELNGADNEGIVDVLSNYLTKNSINIQDMDTNITNAPITGAPLFNLRAIVEKSENIKLAEIKGDLYDLSEKLGVEIKVSD